MGLALAALHLAWQIRRVDIDTPALCRCVFKSNRDFGLIVLAGMVAAKVLA